MVGVESGTSQCSTMSARDCLRYKFDPFSDKQFRLKVSVTIANTERQQKKNENRNS